MNSKWNCCTRGCLHRQNTKPREIRITLLILVPLTIVNPMFPVQKTICLDLVPSWTGRSYNVWWCWSSVAPVIEWAATGAHIPSLGDVPVTELSPPLCFHSATVPEKVLHFVATPDKCQGSLVPDQGNSLLLTVLHWSGRQSQETELINSFTHAWARFGLTKHFPPCVFHRFCNTVFKRSWSV